MGRQNETKDVKREEPFVSIHILRFTPHVSRFTNHVAEPGVVAAITLFITQVDHVIFFALKFFSKQVLEDWADRLDAMIKARIEKDSQKPS